MRIARIRHLFFPDMPYDYFYELSARQVDRGHKVDVISWSQKSTSSVRRVPEGFNIHSLRGLNFASPFGVIENYPYLPGLSTILEKLKPEIVHGESHLFLPTAQAIRKAKKLDLPSVVTVHGVFADRGFSVNLLQNMFIRTLGFEIFSKTDLIICLTQSDVDEITHFGAPLEKIRLVQNAVDIDFFKPAISRNSTLIVWVGRFVNEKGIEYLIRAAKLVSEKSKQTRFLLIGYGPLKLKMKKLAIDLHIPSDSISFGETLERKEIAEILSRSSIFIFPSLKEGMPLALLEAMASGNAIVASDIPGVNEVIQNGYNGLLVLPRNSESIASAVLTLINDENLRKRLSANARKTIEDKFSMDCMLTNLDLVYEEARSKHN